MTEETTEFKRSLGLLDATAIVAGSMIGSGIFIVSADMSRMVGSAGWLIVLWLLTGFITLLAALSYGELASMMPKAGGQFVYIERAYGKFTAFLYGWTVFTVIQTGVIAAVAVAFAKYTAFFFPQLSPDNILFELGTLKISAAQIFAILSIFLLTFINSRGIKSGKIIQLIFTSAKLIALLALIVLGLAIGLQSDVFSQNMQHLWDTSHTWTKGVGGNWTESISTITGIALILALGTAIIGSIFSSDAWNNVTFIAGEIKNPKKNIPLSLLIGTSIVTILYVLANFAYLALIPLHGSPEGADAMAQGVQFAGGLTTSGAPTDRVGTAAASMIFGDFAAAFMAILIMVSTFGCNNGLILSGARVYYAMAKDGLFFKRAGHLTSNSVPLFALMIQAIWASILCLSGSYGDLLDYATFASLLFYIITIAGIFVLRKKEPNVERPYKVFAYPFTPILYIILAAGICTILLITKTQNTCFGLLIVACGIPIYFGRKYLLKA